MTFAVIDAVSEYLLVSMKVRHSGCDDGIAMFELSSASGQVERKSFQKSVWWGTNTF